MSLIWSHVLEYHRALGLIVSGVVKKPYCKDKLFGINNEAVPTSTFWLVREKPTPGAVSPVLLTRVVV